jgi:CHAD domain-containing protein
MVVRSVTRRRSEQAESAHPALTVRTLALTRISAARKALTGRTPSDSAVHRARQELTHARALLRLLHAALDQDSYGTANRSLRDAARHLADARDAAVMATLLRSTASDARVPQRAIRTLLREMRRERGARRAVIHLAHTRSLLSAAKTALLSLRQSADSSSAVERDLARIYKRGHRAYRAAKADKREPSLLHEWRKEAKRLRHVLEVLKPALSRAGRAQSREARQLADILGCHHDAALLAARLRAADLDPRAERRLLAELGRSQVHLQREALHLGKRLYERSPADIAPSAGDWRDWALVVVDSARRGTRASARR